MKKSVVYTKTGDKGLTGLIGGTRVPKNHARLEAYGTIDELMSFIGLIRSYDIPDSDSKTLISVQSKLFTIGAYLATDTSVSDMRSKLKYSDEHIEELELEMDHLENNLPPLKSFLLPGGHPVVGNCHVARTVCRRAERRVLDVAEEFELDNWVIRYLNRLSDYLFVLSRHLSNYYGVDEIPWLPEL
ncbi:cob(I)yrinic acid a,c-diamide adenosyltransferase [Carboxylicivirga caseinilyticus]|uniref:cob(I)yrinic acid a,c-diamide adenosyltransferase n=1 Tax=Carboxylicivirga caseinilyticus TaxID=3417572 RepID=UPI003D33286D|nr:cob(I)yrinic acid a,c-diamide adenosyltransferase [Marinilabiliaceae bacterium A049]